VKSPQDYWAFGRTTGKTKRGGDKKWEGDIQAEAHVIREDD
jgi:hypothetical protein